MVTKYDVFEIVYKNRAPIKPIDVANRLNRGKKEYHLIYNLLISLAREGLVIRMKDGFQVKTTTKTELLYSLIVYCIRNGINYNLILDKNFTRFIVGALQKEEISTKNIKLNSRTLQKYISILDRYGMILIISEKPLRAKVFYNALLNNLILYFGYKQLMPANGRKTYLSEIKRELDIYRKLRKKNEAKYKELLGEFKVSFIYHSLSLEGNPITLPDTIKILKDSLVSTELKIDDIAEIKNYQTALLQMLSDAYNRKPLTLQVVLDYHRLAMGHKISLAGIIRKVPVYINGNPNFKTTTPEKIMDELDSLFSKYNDFIRRKDISLEEILHFAVYFHNRFQHIHPFEDGNSRTTRLITFHILQSMDIPIFDIPFGLLDEYLDHTKGSRGSEDFQLYKNLQKIVLFNLKKINKKLS